MTTIAAVKKGKKVCIGCDSLTIFGSRKEKNTQLQFHTGKIIKYQSSYIGFCGSAVWHEVLNNYFNRVKLQHGLHDVHSTYLEMLRFHRFLKEKYYLTPQQSKEDIFESSEFLILFINSHGIFEVDWMRNVREYSQIAAIGTGDEYALGAMKAVYDKEDDPKFIVEKGLDAAARFDKKTELPVFYYSIDF
jgi:ATP-dependent protease HslVU (ClpYQ) peptidase subunit